MMNLRCASTFLCDPRLFLGDRGSEPLYVLADQESSHFHTMSSRCRGGLALALARILQGMALVVNHAQFHAGCGIRSV